MESSPRATPIFRHTDNINVLNQNPSSPNLPPTRPKHESAPPTSRDDLSFSGRQRSSSGAKGLLTSALQEAQNAVQLDNSGNLPGALDAYEKAVYLLGKVMDVTPAADERERLKMIHDSYRFRIHLLTTQTNQAAAAAAAGKNVENNSSVLALETQTLDGRSKISGTQDLPNSIQQAQQQSIPLPSNTPRSPPPIPPRGHRDPPPHPSRSPPPQAPISPPVRNLRSPNLGPQLQRKTSLTKKGFSSYSTAQAQAQAIQEYISSNANTSNSAAPKSPPITPSSTIASPGLLPRDTTPTRTKQTVSHGPLPSHPIDTVARPPPKIESSPANTSAILTDEIDSIVDEAKDRDILGGEFETGPTAASPTGAGMTRQRNRVGSRPLPGRLASNELAPVPENGVIQPHRRKARDVDNVTMSMNLQTAPKAPLPPPPPNSGFPPGFVSEPIYSVPEFSQSPVLEPSGKALISAPATIFSPLSPPATDSVLDPAPGSAIVPPPLPPPPFTSGSIAPISPPISPPFLPQRSGKSGTPKLKRANAPTLSSSHLNFSSLTERPLSPPPGVPLPTLPMPMKQPASPPSTLISSSIRVRHQLDSQMTNIPGRTDSRGGLEPITEKCSELTIDEDGLEKQAKEDQVSETSSSHRASRSSLSSIGGDHDNSFQKESSAINNNGRDNNSLEAPEQEWLPDLISKSFATSPIFLENLQTSPAPNTQNNVFIKDWYNPGDQVVPPVPPMPPLPQLGAMDYISPVGQKRMSLPSNNGSQLSLSSSGSRDLNNRQFLMGNNESQQSFSSSSSSATSSVRRLFSEPVPVVSESGFGSLSPTSPTMRPTHGKFSKLASTFTHSGSKELSLQDVIAQDPFAGIRPSAPNQLDPPAPSDPFLRVFWFIHLLEQTMTNGGFLSSKLYVPHNIWFQKGSIRLLAVEAKVQTCQALTQFLNAMSSKSKSGKLVLFVEVGGIVEKGERDRNELLKELDALETLTLDLWAKLSKKVSFLQKPEKNDASKSYRSGYHSQSTYSQGSGRQSNPYQGYGDYHNSNDDADPYSWLGSEDPIIASLNSNLLTSASLSSGTLSTGGLSSTYLNSSVTASEKGAGAGGHKRGTSDLMKNLKGLSKSVQKSMNNEKIEDTANYTEALLELFRSSYILESMIKHFEDLPPHQTHIKILGKLHKICDFYNMVVCAFVIRDLGDLMTKYVKRMGAVVAEQ